MKYKVSRTSDWSANKPCEEAFEDSYIQIDERIVDSPEKLNVKSDRDEWYNNGTNHRMENGHIKRDFESRGWFVNIETLEDLNKFVDKYGNIVFQKSSDNSDIKEVEIYDDYREWLHKTIILYSRKEIHVWLGINYEKILENNHYILHNMKI